MTFIRLFSRRLLLLILAVWLPGASLVEGQPKLKPTVILVSIDGFRFDYLDSANCPNLRTIAGEGVRARWLIPVFPTKTFPNHYSIVTGLYAEHHGIVGNTMYDPDFDAVFSLGSESEVRNGRWWGGEPVWVTAEKQGQTSATFFWPGSEAVIASKRPSYWARYDRNVSNVDRVKQVLNWLDYPDSLRPTIVTLYFEAVDDAGHRFGPSFDGLNPAISAVDSSIGILLQGLKERAIFEQVNLLIVSDHGMAATARERTIYLDDYVETSRLRLIDRGIFVSIWAEQAVVDSLARILRDAHPHMKVYRKAEIPDRWKYKNHRRVAPLLLAADEGWGIRIREERSFWQGKENGGDHGYDNSVPSMRAMFIAHGPAFAQGKVVDAFENIHLYSVMCHVLGLSPASHDGDLESVRMLLR